MSIESTMLVVDGDPGTAIPTSSGRWQVPEAVVEGSRERALSHAIACQAADSCVVPSGALLGAGDTTSFRIAAGGAVESDVPLRVLAGSAAGPAQVYVGVRASARAAGGIDWECSAPTVLDSSGQVPVDRAWEACG